MAGSPKSSTATRPLPPLALFGVALLAASLALGAGVSLAAKLNGTKRGDKIVGTQRADTIKGKAGNDTINGRGGNDTLIGGKGRDTIIGGAGADKMLGGPGNDVIKAADGRRDKVINGGAGKNRCVIDTALELSIVRNCSVIAAPPGGGPAPGPGDGLRVLGAEGLVCASPLPICVFTISGDGADAPLGTVTGGGGVTAVGGSVTPSGTNWSAGGLYGCTADGFLRITIGSKSVDVPVTCTM